MKFGLHSGPVTAGVLRGERARFQLFGDTMNTTARIESSSMRDRIHVSQDTADLLIAAGRKSWLELRQDVIIAKGKGALETYWLRPPTLRSRTSTLDLNVTQHFEEEEEEEEDLDDEANKSPEVLKQERIAAAKKAEAMKIERLIHWNSDILLQHLKKIVARRKRMSMSASGVDCVRKVESEIGGAGNVVGEIVDVIDMPDFDASAELEEASNVDLGEGVARELRDLVTVLASMYRNNAFHCFEHASHVTMSVSKLLSRIVAPDASQVKKKAGGGENAAALHDHTYGITSDPLTQFAVILSALVHDLDHRGT